jgi:hypothetical protein
MPLYSAFLISVSIIKAASVIRYISNANNVTVELRSQEPLLLVLWIVSKSFYY